MTHYPTTNSTTTSAAFGIADEPHWLAQFDLASWGIENVAYVRPISQNGEDIYGIFAADGTELATVENRDAAIITVRQNELEPLSAH
ncbi:MAG: DUF1150 family protein [Rhodospirillaceae bacterium]|nr:DUF1150 family protein [Rhodospirillaceae bacterium]